MNLLLRWTLTVLFFIAISACGGGGGGTTGTTSSSNGGDSGQNTGNTGNGTTNPPASTAQQLRLSPDLPDSINASTVLEVIVLAIDANNEARDVTASAQVSSSGTATVTSSVQNGKLRLSFGQIIGTVNLAIQAENITFTKSVLVTGTGLGGQAIQKLQLSLQYPGFASLVPDATGVFRTIPGRPLTVQTSAILNNGNSNVSSEAQLTSSDPTLLALTPVATPDGIIQWYEGTTAKVGSTTLTATWGGTSGTAELKVTPAAVLYARTGGAHAVTENAQGRLTAYASAGADDGSEQVGFAVSATSGQWTPFSALAKPAGAGLIATVVASESPNGFRAAATITGAGQVWIHLISPNGTVKGPLMLNSAPIGGGIMPPAISVSDDGTAHVWMRYHDKVTRMVARYSDSTVSTIGSLNLVLASIYNPPQIAISPSGTVGIVWLEANCTIRYVFDAIATPVSLSTATPGTTALTSCDADSFHLSGFRTAAGTGELSAAVHYPKGSNVSIVALVSIPGTGAAVTTLLDEDSEFVPGRAPQLAMYPSGELVTIWQTRDRGVRAVHRPAGGPPSAAFQVEAPTFTLATPDVEGIYLRGNQRFLLAWTGGQNGVTDRLSFREYSKANGVGIRQSFPYEVISATNQTKLTASGYGISAISSFHQSLSVVEIYAVHNFLP